MKKWNQFPDKINQDQLKIISEILLQKLLTGKLITKKGEHTA